MRFKKTQVIALANQKGGCGKTTSAVSIAAAFNKRGYSVAVVDTDPQCNATVSFGVDPDELQSKGQLSLVDVYMKKRAAIDIQIGFGDRFDNRLFLIPGHKSLTGLGARFNYEMQLAISEPGSSELDADEIKNEQRHRLRESLESLRGVHDVIIIDTPPNLDILMTTALIAADWFIIPVFPSGYDMQGLETLTRTITKIRQKFNPGLQLAGVLFGNFDRSANLDAHLQHVLYAKFGEKAVFQTTIGRSVRMRELTVLNRTVFEHEPAKAQAEQFLQLVDEMINRATKGEHTANPMPKLDEVLEQASATPNNFVVTPEMLEVAHG